MIRFWKILIIVLILLYIFSPVDLLPGLHPIGLLDDAFLTGLLIYYLKTGQMPAFVLWLWRLIFGDKPFGQRRGGADAFPGREEKIENTRDHGPPRPAPKDPYAVLGLSPGASKEEIQAAYRKLAQQYHPDKVAHLGADLQALAKEKFVEIQQAQDALMRR